MGTLSKWPLVVKTLMLYSTPGYRLSSTMEVWSGGTNSSREFTRWPLVGVLVTLYPVMPSEAGECGQRGGDTTACQEHFGIVKPLWILIRKYQEELCFPGEKKIPRKGQGPDWSGVYWLGSADNIYLVFWKQPNGPWDLLCPGWTSHWGRWEETRL